MEVFLESSSQSTNPISQYYLNHYDLKWQSILVQALETMDRNYLHQLIEDKSWFPGIEQLLAAFSLPLAKTRYILLGESPYPRKNSANGYAFWDNAVGNLWSSKGLSTAVNRATSLRNLIKMLLIARGDLKNNTSQASIALLDKSSLVQTAEQLFQRMMSRGMLLLNASLVYSEGKVPYHARQWKPFIRSLLAQIVQIKPNVQLILLGKIAEAVAHENLPIGLMAEHPYNISFVTNQRVIDFFNPLDLLHYESY